MKSATQTGTATIASGMSSDIGAETAGGAIQFATMYVAEYEVTSAKTSPPASIHVLPRCNPCRFACRLIRGLSAATAISFPTLLLPAADPLSKGSFMARNPHS